MESAPLLQTNPEIYHAGFLVDARKEFSEANITLALLQVTPCRSPDDIGVDVTAYLKGLGDAAGRSADTYWTPCAKTTGTGAKRLWRSLTSSTPFSRP